ncbi:tetratricopeptide repeat protein [Streptomyces sp. ISL-98]|nr:tetratricopeptide repeat protein [Streptomyces sp. ISL-98]
METAQQTAQPVKRRRSTVAVLAGAAVLVAVAAGLLTLVLVAGNQGPPPPPGPVGRAMAAVGAVGAGSPASASDLGALIGDRRTWLRRHPHDDSSWAVLGSAYLERGRWTGDPGDYPLAERALRHSLSVRPEANGNLDALVGLAALAHERGDYRAAKHYGEMVRARSPQRWTAYAVLSDAYSRLGDQKAAAGAVEKLGALGAGPGYTVGRLSAEVYWNRGWREDAAATLSDATALAATPAEKAAGLNRMGDLAWERGEAQEALGHYETALGVVPGHGRALAGRARVLASLGLTDEAEHMYRAALAALPVPELGLEYGELLESRGKADEAAEQYTLVRARVALGAARGGTGSGSGPGSGAGSGVLLLGLLDADHRDPGAAVARLRAEWKRHPNAYVADALGWALYREGESDGKEALKYARKATDQGLRNAVFLYHLGAIEKHLGKDGAARRHLEEALRVNPSFSPLLAPRAREALGALGEPAEGGPRDVYGRANTVPTAQG